MGLVEMSAVISRLSDLITDVLHFLFSELQEVISIQSSAVVRLNLYFSHCQICIRQISAVVTSSIR